MGKIYRFKRITEGNYDVGALRLKELDVGAFLRSGSGLNEREVRALCNRKAVIIAYYCSQNAARTAFGDLIASPRLILTTLGGRRIAGTINPSSAFKGYFRWYGSSASGVRVTRDSIERYAESRCDICGAVLRGTPTNGLCPRCAKWRALTRRNYHGHSEPFMFEPRGTKHQPREKVLHIGGEVELNVTSAMADESCARLCEAISAAVDGKDARIRDNCDTYFRFESDSSLANNGCECITQAYTFKRHAAMLPRLRKAFEAARAEGAYVDGRCGLHVHIDRAYFGGQDKEAAAKIAYIVSAFQRQFLKLSARTSRGYCSPSGILKKDGIITAWQKTRNLGHCGEVNTSPTGTIEIRIFGGTMDADKMIAYFDMAQALARAAKRVSYDRLEHFSFGDLGRYLARPVQTVAAFRAAGLDSVGCDALLAKARKVRA